MARNVRHAFLVAPWTREIVGRRKALQFLASDNNRLLKRKPNVFLCCAGKSRRNYIESHPLKIKYSQNQNYPLNLAPLHFINLTNGIEALSKLHILIADENVRFTRIQSSLCERAAYNKVLAQVDNELLFALACGRDCYVYDFGSRNKRIGVPRALFLGLQFIKWSLAYLWFETESPALVPSKIMVRGKNLVPYWRTKVMPYIIEKDTKKMIRYFAAYARELGVRRINLHAVYGRVSEIDGCKELHVKMIRKWLEPQTKDDKSDSDVASWMKNCGFALYDPDSTFEQLTETQAWITSLSEDR